MDTRESNEQPSLLTIKTEAAQTNHTNEPSRFRVSRVGRESIDLSQTNQIRKMSSLTTDDIQDYAKDTDDHTEYKMPFFTLTAKNRDEMHYSVHLMQKAAKENAVNDVSSFEASNNEKLPTGSNRRSSNTSSYNARKGSMQNKLINVKATIDDDSLNAKTHHSAAGIQRSKANSKASIFDVFPDLSKTIPTIEIVNTDTVTDTTNMKEAPPDKSLETIKEQVDNQVATFKTESETTTGSDFLKVHRTKLVINKNRKLSGLLGDVDVNDPDRKYRFSIIKEEENVDPDRQSMVSFSNISKYHQKRRKSLHPSEAFSTSEEVTRARRLSIFGADDWNNKQSKYTQRISITKRNSIFSLHSRNGDSGNKIIDKNEVVETGKLDNVDAINGLRKVHSSKLKLEDNDNNNNNNNKDIESNEIQQVKDDDLSWNEEDMSSSEENSQGHDSLKAFLINICMIYGLIMSICGIGVCIAAVVTDSENDALANNNEYFFIYLYISSIIWMVFCFIDIRSCNKREKKLEKLANNEHNESNDGDDSVLNLILVFIKDKIFVATKRRIKTFLLRFKFISYLDNKMCQINSGQFSGYFYDYKYGAGGLYLKVGVAVFCTVSLINTTLVIAEMLERERECRRNSSLASEILFFIFQFIQFCFIFRHSNLIIHNYKGIARLAVLNIAVTNLCVWIRTIIIETEEQYDTFEHPNKQFHVKSALDAINCNLTSTSAVRSVQKQLAPYLYPCTVEYAVTSLTLFYIIWKNIGKKNKGSFSDILKTNEMESVFNIDCHKTSRGLFCGIIILLCTVVTNIMYFIYKDHFDAPEHAKSTLKSSAVSYLHFNTSVLGKSGDLTADHAQEINHYLSDLLNEYRKNSTVEINDLNANSTIIIEVLELVLISISTIIVMFAMYRTRKLAVIEHGSMVFDEVLVVLSLCGIYIFSVFSAIAIIYSTNRTTIAYLTLTISILSMIEGTLQTYLILDGLRRRAVEPKDRRVKPGRELFTILVIINLSLWLSDTLAFKRFEVNPYQLSYYSVLAWSIINTISSPLAIFFRFHSSVCLSDCWKSIYL